ncbi:MAG: NADP-dependent glyceraldehyde-3-phosphate dehydrogenase [Desulfobulbaceae bacterium]|nr:MAG: NADP-dependent glyceraldehyde-3-phosphate dehydrogenase [Desulfobulbaceae bacterium]
MTSVASTTIFPTPDMVPEKYRISFPMEQRHYLCNGVLREWTGPRQEVLSPIFQRHGATVSPTVLGSYPLLTKKQALATLAAAAKAYDHGRGEWPAMTGAQRCRRIAAFAERLEEKRADIVKLLMWEVGKSKSEAEKEFDRTILYMRDTLAAMADLERASSRLVKERGVLAQIRRVPLGVVLCMGPFNYPLNESFATLIPALIMGNSVIFKPPKLGVLLHHLLLEAYRDCFPAGVINTVYGEGQEVISPLLQSAHIDVLAFIGSSRVATTLKKQHPKPHRLRSILGMEAKNAAIVLKDADLQQAVDECLSGSLTYNGQRCTALKILFVHDDLLDDFLGRFCRAVEQLPCGMPWDEGVQITPLPEPNKVEYLKGLLDDACAKGARIINRAGGSIDHSLMTPAVVYPVQPDMRLYSEEQFGPIVAISPFSTTEQVIEYVTLSDYGQQVSIFGRDTELLAELVTPLANQVCRVNINSQCQRGPDSLPFTGRKDSAEGTLSVTDALQAFSISTIVAARENAENKRLLPAVMTREPGRSHTGPESSS